MEPNCFNCGHPMKRVGRRGQHTDYTCDLCHFPWSYDAKRHQWGLRIRGDRYALVNVLDLVSS